MHRCKRIEAGCYEYRGHTITDMTAEYGYKCWVVTNDDMFTDPYHTDTKADAKACIDERFEMEGYFS